MKSAMVFSVVAVLAVALFSVSAEAAGKKGAKTPSASAETAAKGGVEASSGEGKVLEVLSGGEYTYLRVKFEEGSNWVACPKTEVKKGAVVIVPAGLEMRNFESAALKRTFPLVYLVSGVEAKGAERKGEGAAAPAASAPAPEKQGVKVTGIQKAPGGKTVEEILGGKKDLGGQEVVVRGKVVKRNLGIMKKTWLHVQDGTGAQGTDDLIVTTQAEFEVGDVVLVKGKVSVDKDFGFGYRYDVMIEDADVTKE